MYKILIQSVVGDDAASAVAWALGELDVGTAIWKSSRFPGKQSVSFQITETGFQFTVNDDASQIRLSDDLKLIWLRRRGLPTHLETLHPADQDYVRSERRFYLDSIDCVLSQRYKTVNDPIRDNLARRKLGQLDFARGYGFRFPETLVTNDPEILTSFWKLNGEIIGKTFEGRGWEQKQAEGSAKLYVPYTAPITAKTLEQTDSISASPMIYQSCIDKEYELRVFVAGIKMTAVRIWSQQAEGGQYDNRLARTLSDDVVIEHFILDEETTAFIHAYMKHFCLDTGSFDFLVGKDGQIYFLECNPMGQFLWIDQYVPEEHSTLNMFARYLAHEAGVAINKSPTDILTLQGWRDSNVWDAFIDERFSPEHAAQKMFDYNEPASTNA